MKDIPGKLKAERLSLGWTLQDLSDRTRISITVLRALESGKTEKLGSPFTIDALLKRYSDALRAQTEQIGSRPQKTIGRDAARSGKTLLRITSGLLLIAAFGGIAFWGHRLWQTRDSRNLSPKSHVSPPSHTEATPIITSEQKTSSGHEELPVQHREQAEVKNQAPEPSPPDVTDNSASTSEERVIRTREPDETPVVSKEAPAHVRPGHLLEIVTHQRTWIQVVLDGKDVDTELLHAGQTRKWQAMEKVNLVVGNGGGARVLWDGKPVEISRKRGRVVRLTLPEP